MKPLYFGPKERRLFGWLHGAAGAARTGLVVCNPSGYESVPAHPSMRHFCQAAADAGIVALRFDYDGTGDSAGNDREPARLAAWVKSVHHAIDLLRERGGVDRIALLGVRLGALLATLAAVERDDVANLVAIAPFVTGKAYLRELRALQLAIERPPTPPGVVVEAGVQEAIGYALTPETQTALGAVDLTKLARPPAPSVLLIERDDLPGSNLWPDRLVAQGVSVECLRLPGYVEMMLAPQDAELPAVIRRATTDWLRQRADQHPDARASRPASVAATLPTRAHLEGVVESAEFVDEQRRVFGVLANPESPPSRRRGLLLLNAGVAHHIGSNRLYVTLARRWARLGHAVLRLDLSGIGDSGARAGERESDAYPAHASEDIRAAVAFLRAQPGVVDVQALGICSGGYHAFKAAVAGISLDGVVLINPLTFSHEPELPLEAAPLVDDGEATRSARQKKWGRRHPRVTDRRRGHLRRARISKRDNLSFELESLARRNIAVRFLYSAGDPGVTLLEDQAGATVAKLHRRGQLVIDVIEGADHTFMPLWSQSLFIAKLAAHFDGLPQAFGQSGHVQMGIYFDDEHDLENAKALWRGLREQSRP